MIEILADNIITIIFFSAILYIIWIKVNMWGNSGKNE